MNRQDKIKLLNGIAAGRTSTDVLKTARFVIRVGYKPEDNEWLMNGKPVAKDDFTGQLKARKTAHPHPFSFKVNYQKA